MRQYRHYCMYMLQCCHYIEQCRHYMRQCHHSVRRFCHYLAAMPSLSAAMSWSTMYTNISSFFEKTCFVNCGTETGKSADRSGKRAVGGGRLEGSNQGEHSIFCGSRFLERDCDKRFSIPFFRVKTLHGTGSLKHLKRRYFGLHTYITTVVSYNNLITQFLCFAGFEQFLLQTTAHQQGKES